jgi:uncharacterized protein (UPF0332 family)
MVKIHPLDFLKRQNIKRSKHSGVIAAFAQHLVKPGRFALEHHRAL